MNEGRLIVTTGASRSGKTAITVQETKASSRLLVWDPKGKWATDAHCQKVISRRELVSLIKSRTSGRFAYNHFSAEEFDFFCQAAFAWGRQGHDIRKQTDVVLEEIANVTSPAKAPPGAHRLISQGLEFGINIHAITQRPSESDKTCIGNASIIRTFRMSRAQDRKYMAAELDVDPAELQKLQTLDWIARDMNTHEITRGKLTFPR